jgi:hypothetical protein
MLATSWVWVAMNLTTSWGGRAYAVDRTFEIDTRRRRRSQGAEGALMKVRP